MFDYRYSFSMDEDIIRRYDSESSVWLGNTIFETRIKFIVRGNSNSGERIIIDSESYAVGAFPKYGYEGYLELHIGMRLKDYWMPDRQIRTMIHQLLLFAKQIGTTGRRGKIPAAVDLEVCTVQREGEAMGAAVERAMRPEYLPPLYLYAVDGIGNSWAPPRLGRYNMNVLQEMQAAAIRVEDVDRAFSVMDVCAICGRKPIVGTQIATLPCGHAFHYHCIARPLLEEGNYCPISICHHQPAFNRHFNYKCEEHDVLETFWRQLRDDNDEFGFDFPEDPAPAHF